MKVVLKKPEAQGQTESFFFLSDFHMLNNCYLRKMGGGGKNLGWVVLPIQTASNCTLKTYTIITSLLKVRKLMHKKSISIESLSCQREKPEIKPRSVWFLSSVLFITLYFWNTVIFKILTLANTPNFKRFILFKLNFQFIQNQLCITQVNSDSFSFFTDNNKHCLGKPLKNSERCYGWERTRNKNLTGNSFKSNRLHLGAQMLKIYVCIKTKINIIFCKI